MDRGRVISAVLVLAVLSLGINVYYAYSTRRNWDETFHVKSSLHRTSDCLEGMGYVYSIDHPTLKRHLYRLVLLASGIDQIDTPSVDYHKGVEWNFEHGHIPPWNVVLPLRLANAALMTAAVLLVFASALLVLRNAWLAALVALPLALSEHIAVGVVGYLGCDALLAFLLALSLFVMLFLVKKRTRGLWKVLALGVIGGLAASAKFNGALVVVAFMIYLALTNRGADRLVRPAFLALVSVLVFIALNPVMRAGGGLGWMLSVVWDMLERRKKIWLSQYEEWELTRVQLAVRFFPWAAFVYPLLAAFAALRRKRWALPLLLWSLVLAAGTLFSVNRTYKRYFLPVEMAVLAAGGIVAWALLREELGQLWARFKPGLKRAALLALGAAAVGGLFLASGAALAPLGPSRLRRGAGPAAKAALFYRQAAGYLRAAEPLPDGEAAEFVSAGRPETPEEPEALFSPLTRRVLGQAVALAGLVALGVFAARALGSAWAALAFLLPLLWLQFGEGCFHMQTVSQSFLLLFAGCALAALVRISRAEVTLKGVLPAALLSGAAAAASPGALVLVAAGALFVARKSPGGRRGLGAAAIWTAAAFAAYAVAEPCLWYAGAQDTLRFYHSVFAGAPAHWTTNFSLTSDFLMPIQEAFWYWPLLPLGAAVLVAARDEPWARPAALFAALAVAAHLVLAPAAAKRLSLTMHLALAVGAALPGLWLLSRHVRLSWGWREQAERASGREETARGGAPS